MTILPLTTAEPHCGHRFLTDGIRPVSLEPFFSLSVDPLAVLSATGATFVRANPALASLLGWGEADLLEQSFTAFIHAEDAPAARSFLAEEPESPCFEARFRRRDGSYRLISWLGVRAVAGFVHLVGRDAAKPIESVPEDPPLLAEIQHRARNTLGVIRSIARRTARNSETVDGFANHLDGRIGAFARVQSAIMRDPIGGLSLPQLVADELAACAAHEGEAVTIKGPAIHLRPKAAETFGLAMHELAMNAVKHGALATPEGRIDVSWVIGEGVDPQRLRFSWKETGLSEALAEPISYGFGRELLERTLPYEMKATTRWSMGSDGLLCEIDIPLHAGVAFTESGSQRARSS